MNKLVKIFNGAEVLEVIKVDTETAESIKKGETKTFILGNGLQGTFNDDLNIVELEAPKINVLLYGSFKGVEGVKNVMLNKKQTQEIKRYGRIENVSFVEIQGVKWSLILNDDETIKAISSFDNVGLGYYTENNLTLNK